MKSATLSIRLEENIKEMLKEISNKSKRSVTKEIEYLIEQEYNKEVKTMNAYAIIALKNLIDFEIIRGM